jgi:hypothetical protein
MRLQRVQAECKKCGRITLQKPSDLNRGDGKYCSIACYNAARMVPREGARICRGCNTLRPVASFPRRADRGPDARVSRCQPCITESGRSARNAYARTPKGRAAAKKYRQSQLGRAADRAKRTEYALNGNREKYYNKWKERRREKYLLLHRAAQRVQTAIKNGKLQRPSECSNCGIPCKPQAHHHNGYTEEHMLDVRWLCIPCHEADHHTGSRAT